MTYKTWANRMVALVIPTAIVSFIPVLFLPEKYMLYGTIACCALLIALIAIAPKVIEKYWNNDNN